jgi:AcrR family transcriptional regulator
MTVTRGDTRARILDTAWGLVRERGIDAVTVADIAAATGVSRQLLYVHFENRAGLLKAMARRHDVRSGFAGRAA